MDDRSDEFEGKVDSPGRDCMSVVEGPFALSDRSQTCDVDYGSCVSLSSSCSGKNQKSEITKPRRDAERLRPAVGTTSVPTDV